MENKQVQFDKQVQIIRNYLRKAAPDELTYMSQNLKISRQSLYNYKNKGPSRRSLTHLLLVDYLDLYNLCI